MKRSYFVKCCLKYGGYFVAELLLAYILAKAVVQGNTIIGDAIDDMLSGQRVNPGAFMGVLLGLTGIGFIAAF